MGRMGSDLTRSSGGEWSPPRVSRLLEAHSLRPPADDHQAPVIGLLGNPKLPNYLRRRLALCQLYFCLAQLRDDLLRRMSLSAHFLSPFFLGPALQSQLVASMAL